MIVVADASGNVAAFDPGGVMAAGWPVALGQAVVLDLALGNVAGDSLPEVVLASGSTVRALRGDGGPAASPVLLPAPATDAPALADLTGDDLADVLVTAGGGLHAYAFSPDTARVLGWPRRSADRVTPSVAELDGDGRAEVAAGVAVRGGAGASDSTLYCYDAGPGSFHAAGLAWPTARGNAGRTGALGAPAPPSPDDVPPAAVTDLAVVAVSETTLTLAWTAVGDDGGAGRAAAYDLRYSLAPITAASFDALPAGPSLAPPDTAGSPQSATVEGLASGTLYYFAVRVADRAGNASPLSNVPFDVTAAGSGPLRGITRPALRVAPHPAQGEALLYFRAQLATPPVESVIEIFDLGGRCVRRLPLGTRVQGVVAWNGKDEAGGLVPAGVYFARLVSGAAKVKTRLIWLP
jgi:hypothetical protein